jgi:hypothetical protein
MARAFLSAVRYSLQGYADRGVFRGFSEVKKSEFKFVWMTQKPIELSVDARNHVLRFKQLLPDIPASSTLYQELKSFIRERHQEGLPEHRRIDPERAGVSCSNRRGVVSVSLKVQSHHYSYGVNRIVNLVHELFVYLRDAHPQYLAENFDVPQE